ADDAEGRVGELVWLGAPELAVHVPLRDVEYLGPLLDTYEELQELSDHRCVEVGQRVPVRLVEVGEHLSVPVEDRDLVLPHDDVVVEPDLPWHLPQGTALLELVVPRNGSGAEGAAARRRNRV